MKLSPSPSCKASTHQRCQRKLWRRRVPKSEMRQRPLGGQRPQPLDLAPQLGLGAGVEQSRSKRLIARVAARARNSLMIASAGISHIVVCAHGPAKRNSYWPSLAGQLVFGQAEVGEPFHEVRFENLLGAVETVAGEPDQLVLGEPQRARVVELVDQFALVDDLGEPHLGRPIDQLEGHLRSRCSFQIICSINSL